MTQKFVPRMLQAGTVSSWRSYLGGNDGYGSQEGESWLIVYLDVITLLLVLFVFLVQQGPAPDAVEAPDEVVERLEPAAVPPWTERELPAQPAELEPAYPAPSQEPVAEDAGRSERLEQAMRAALSDAGGAVELTARTGGLQLEIGETVLFDQGRAELKPRGRAVLADVAAVLRAQSSRISVEGHTDSVPISNPRFPSNWELSTQRATTVVRFLLGAGIPKERLRAIGYADTHPRDDNASEAGRARNRRVALVVDLID
jgi:chemotaxis protein MotB